MRLVFARVPAADAARVIRCVSALDIDETIRWWQAHGITSEIVWMAISGSPERNNASWRIVRRRLVAGAAVIANAASR